MKNFVYLFLSTLFIWSCATNTTLSKKSISKKEEPVRIANDSLEYEITIIDIGFNSYLATAKPQTFYTVDYLESRNRIYVSFWNERYRNGYKPNFYENEINYKYDIHYGLEVNYLLYNYFKFVEKKYGEKFNN